MRILVAEDVGVTRRLLGEVLTDLGHDVTCVSDGTSAWETFSGEPFPFVLLDWMMPGLDGLDVARRIRGAPAGDAVFILLQTGRATSEDLSVALQAGIDDYIAKPVTPEHLRARIAIALQRMEQRRARVVAEAEAARARWLAGVAETALALQHEMSSPLSALIGEISMALETATPASMRSALHDAQLHAGRVTDILRRLSVLRSPRTIELLPGLRMLDLQPHDEDRA